MKTLRYTSFVLVACALFFYNAAASENTAAQTHESQSAITPQQALQMLKDGNERFAASRMLHRDLLEQVKETSKHQYPFAAIVSCMDSRTSAELIFDQGIGDIFSIRIAGNIVNDDILGSLEYAAKVTGVKLIVVMGHTQCGAIKGACDNVKLGNLTSLLEKIKPAIDMISKDAQPRTSKNATFVQDVAVANVKLALQVIKKNSPILREMLGDKKIALVGAMYDIRSGKVTFYK